MKKRSGIKFLKLVLYVIVSFFSINTIIASGVNAKDSSKLVTLVAQNSTIREIFENIQEQTDYHFIYNEEDIDHAITLSFNLQEKGVDDVLELILEKLDLTYELFDNKIIVKPDNNIQETQEKVIFTGTVKDEEGFPLPGVNIINQNRQGTVTDVDGKFEIYVNEGDLISFSFIGMVTEMIEIENIQKGIIRISRDVILKENLLQLEEIVANGYFVRKKETYTGNTSTVKGEDLIKIGTDNILKSLNVLDPSFQIIENNDLGSNPNQLPEIRFRGTSSFSDNIFDESDKNLLKTDPNRPTFILDGFEVTLEDIVDMDMNRVESITILKDAVAASIYGARAANGVFVIKTKAPEVGKLAASYNTALMFQFADLSTYDLLSGRELFDLQKNLGLYTLEDAGLAPKYNQINRWLYEGVDTDWMSQPVRNVVTQRHSLNLSGGDKHMRYSLNTGYSSTPGVMKGSFRDNFNVNLGLHYQMNERLRFSYSLGFNENHNNTGSYGAFRNYAELPPYFPLYDKQGNLTKTFEDDSGNAAWGQTTRYNPLYEAGLGNFSEGTYLKVFNNFNVTYKITNDLRINATVSYSNNKTENISFTNPESLTYANSNVPLEDRGIYRKDNINLKSFDSNAMLNYMKMMDKHQVSLSAGSNISTQTNEATGFTAQGFSNDMYFPSHAKGYEINGFPRGEEQTSRMIGFLSSMNYSFKNTYLFDASFRADGSSAYGKDKRFAPFFSVGVGYNIHNETFMKRIGWISRLKVNGTYGETGSISFSPYQAKDMFRYLTDTRYLDEIGVTLKALGNESLVWQTTKAKEIGIQMSLFKDLVDINTSIYDRETVDLIAPLDLPPSLGFTTMTSNIGTMQNRGFDFNIRSFILRKNDHNVYFSVSGAHNKNKIVEINGGLKSYNERAEDSAGDITNPENSFKFVSRYVVGQSMTDIYAVRSLGIDPETGQELFLDKDGNPTWEWSSTDMVVVGNSQPDLEGAIILNYSYKRFSCGINSIYRFGAQAYNQTLLNRVENSNKYMNVDRRVYEETWQKPGDQVSFKANANNEVTQASSRFIQDDNVFYINGINVNYSFAEHICKKLHVRNLMVGLNLNDILYLSTIKRERGIEYPFARSFTFTLSTNF